MTYFFSLTVSLALTVLFAIYGSSPLSTMVNLSRMNHLIACSL